MSEFDDIFNKVNWKQLAEQKKSLKIIVGTLDDKNYEIVHRYMPKLKLPKKERHLENLNKIVTLIDQIQNAAIEKGIPLNQVYPIAERVSLVIGAKKNVN